MHRDYTPAGNVDFGNPDILSCGVTPDAFFVGVDYQYVLPNAFGINLVLTLDGVGLDSTRGIRR